MGENPVKGVLLASGRVKSSPSLTAGELGDEAVVIGLLLPGPGGFRLPLQQATLFTFDCHPENEFSGNRENLVARSG